jgi:phage gp29-like protein
MPLDPAKVKSAVLAATSPEDLADKLFALVGEDVSEPEFRETLERALYAADVLGYVSAEG